MDGVGGDRKSGRSGAVRWWSSRRNASPARKRSAACGQRSNGCSIRAKLSPQIGMFWSIRMDELLCAVLGDLNHLDRFVRSQ